MIVIRENTPCRQTEIGSRKNLDGEVRDGVEPGLRGK